MQDINSDFEKRLPALLLVEISKTLSTVSEK